jgi:hypothetical protein
MNATGAWLDSKRIEEVEEAEKAEKAEDAGC